LAAAFNVLIGAEDGLYDPSDFNDRLLLGFKGTFVVRRVSWTSTHQGLFLGVVATGRRVRGDGIVIIRLADAEIVEEWEMSNLLGLLQQLGAVPHFSMDAAP
jgi:predicted ester cyclase